MVWISLLPTGTINQTKMKDKSFVDAISKAFGISESELRAAYVVFLSDISES